MVERRHKLSIMTRIPTLLLLLLSISLLGSLSAQETLPDETYEDTEATIPDPASQARLEKIATKLQLTEAQIPQVAAILETFAATTAANPATTPEAKRAQRRALRTEVMALLSPEQRALVKRGKANTNGGQRQGPNKPATQPAKRNWFDLLLDEVATPLLNNRRGKRQN